MKPEIIVCIALLVLVSFLIFTRYDGKEKFSGGQSLDCYLKSLRAGAPTFKKSINSNGYIEGVDVITGINLGGGIHSSDIAIVWGQQENSWNAQAGFNPIPYFPALGRAIRFKTNGRPLVVYGFQLSDAEKHEVMSKTWNYYFHNDSYTVSNGNIGFNIKNPHCTDCDLECQE